MRITPKVWMAILWVLAMALFFGCILHPPRAGATDPPYCFSTGQWLPWPGNSGYCPDGQAPFDGPGPNYGGGNHRWPDGSDD